MISRNFFKEQEACETHSTSSKMQIYYIQQGYGKKNYINNVENLLNFEILVEYTREFLNFILVTLWQIFVQKYFSEQTIFASL